MLVAGEPVGILERISLSPREVPRDLILRLQRYREPARAPHAIRTAAEVAAREATELIVPRAVTWRGAVTAVDPGGSVTLAGGERFGSRLLARLLAAATDAYVVVLTLGDALEREVDRLFAEGSALEALLLDTAAWASIVLLARDLRRRLLDAERPAGRSVTHRVAPGYGDWPVDDQRALLRVFGDAPLPVTLTESSLMLPRKSITAVFGVVPPDASTPWTTGRTRA